MNLKNSIIEYGANVGIVMGGFYLIYGENSKYLNFVAFVSVIITRYMGKLVGEMLQKDNAGGTTPLNPLKIPAKKNPIH